jgi:hypothetical protein
MPSNKITWETLDEIKEEKSSDWFWIVAIVAIAIAVLAIFFDNILFALLILLAAFASFLLANAPARLITCEISRKGIRVADILYPYSSLESFWVIDEDGYDRDRILLKSKKLLMPLVVVPLGEGVDPEEIRDYLLEYLNEEEMYEPLFQRLMSMLGF